MLRPNPFAFSPERGLIRGKALGRLRERIPPERTGPHQPIQPVATGRRATGGATGTPLAASPTSQGPGLPSADFMRQMATNYLAYMKGYPMELFSPQVRMRTERPLDYRRAQQMQDISLARRFGGRGGGGGGAGRQYGIIKSWMSGRDKVIEAAWAKYKRDIPNPLAASMRTDDPRWWAMVAVAYEQLKPKMVDDALRKDVAGAIGLPGLVTGEIPQPIVNMAVGYGRIKASKDDPAEAFLSVAREPEALAAKGLNPQEAAAAIQAMGKWTPAKLKKAREGMTGEQHLRMRNAARPFLYREMYGEDPTPDVIAAWRRDDAGVR